MSKWNTTLSFDRETYEIILDISSYHLKVNGVLINFNDIIKKSIDNLIRSKNTIIFTEIDIKFIQQGSFKGGENNKIFITFDSVQKKYVMNIKEYYTNEGFKLKYNQLIKMMVFKYYNELINK